MKAGNGTKTDNITLGGLLLQLSFIVISVTITLFWKYSALQHLMWHTIAPLGVWLHWVIQPHINKINPGSINTDKKRFSFIKKIFTVISRFGPTIDSLFIAACLVQSTFDTATPFLKLTVIPTNKIPVHLPLVLFSLLSFAGTLITIYYIKISILQPWQHLRGVSQYLASTTLFFLLLLINSIFNYFNVTPIDSYITLSLKVINTILAAELLFVFLASFFKPSASAAGRQRPLYHSYVLEIVLYPQRTAQTIGLLLQSLLGYDITVHSFVNQLRSFIFPLIAASGVFMFLLSSFAIIRPEEKGILLKLGKADPQPLGPGLHLKPPFPFGKIRKFDVSLIRQMHIGSHKPQVMGGTVFKEGVPLLWTTDHGVSNDELLIIASPKKLMQHAAESGAKVNFSSNKTPSVSLAGADIVLEYIINNVSDFSMAGSDPEKMLYLLSEAEVSRHLLSFDIDTLFSDGRIGMAQVLKEMIQSKSLAHHLGIRILNVSITAVHPPTEIADVFEENVSALQERETKIQQAQQSTLRAQVETAGSVEAFKELAEQINIEEGDSLTDRTKSEQMILKCGGNISRIISEATGYRWSKEYTEHGKSEKFTGELNLYKTSKDLYCHERYFSILEEALSTKNKILVSQRHKDLIFDFGSKGRQLPDNFLRNQRQSQ